MIIIAIYQAGEYVDSWTIESDGAELSSNLHYLWDAGYETEWDYLN